MLKLKSAGLQNSTLKPIDFRLKFLAKHADLAKPEQVKEFIANMPNADSYKLNMTKAYNYLCVCNGFKWEKPKYKAKQKIPLIPTTENVNKIISATTKKYGTIFTILAETGLEAHELASVRRKDIDVENGIINAQGCKGHAPRSFKLKQATKAMLAEYLYKYKKEKPFQIQNL